MISDDVVKAFGRESVEPPQKSQKAPSKSDEQDAGVKDVE